MLRYFFILLLFPIIVSAIEVKDIRLENYRIDSPSAAYLTIENDSDKVDYLLGVEIVNQPNAKAVVYKSVLDQGVARNAKIDRLAIPANSKVELNPLGIYIVLYGLEKNKEPIELKFHFSSGNVLAFASTKK